MECSSTTFRLNKRSHHRKSFKKAGYDTACIGKWHVDGHGRDTLHSARTSTRLRLLESPRMHARLHQFGILRGHTGKAEMGWLRRLRPNRRCASLHHEPRKKLRSHFSCLLAWGPPHNPYGIRAGTICKRCIAPKKSSFAPTFLPKTPNARRIDLAGYYAHCTALDHCVGDLWRTLKRCGLDGRIRSSFSPPITATCFGRRKHSQTTSMGRIDPNSVVDSLSGCFR